MEKYKDIRTLRSDEIEIRVGTIKKDGSGASFLLYKDARCDMNILDEVFGYMNWKREHTRDNANCIVSIWDNDKKEWVSKEDTGTESFTEKEKGLASDSFKRACFNWGIGRELYTAPFIWINLTKEDISEYNGKIGIKTKFTVTEIGYNENKEINKLTIADDKKIVRFKYNENALKDNKANEKNIKIAIDLIKKCETEETLETIINGLEEEIKMQIISTIELQQEVVKGIAEMNNCKTKEETLLAWSKYKHIQTNDQFIKAKNDKKTQLKID